METRQITDQTGRTITFPRKPIKVVCLVPSISELVYDLGIGDRFVGCTRFCIHPTSLKKDLIIIGGTKKINLETIDKISPDLILANKEENTKEEIEFLAQKYPLYLSDIGNLDEALNMIQDVGDMLNARDIADTLTYKITQEFIQLNPHKLNECLYLIWNKPYMAVAEDTFIGSMLNRIGFNNVLANETRYPVLTEDQIVQLNPSVVLLSSEPFPFGEKHIAGLQELLPKAKIILVDGEMFSWYGSRLLKSVTYFHQLMSDHFT